MATRIREAMGRSLEELRFEPTEKRVRALLAGEEVVDSTQALGVWEPRRVVPSCKGRASHWSLDVAGRPHQDLAWTHEDPLQGAAAVAGLVAFYDERVAVVLDGERRPRPRTAVSKAIVDEAGITEG